MYYGRLRFLNATQRRATVSSLKSLRTGLSNEIPAKQPGNLLLATWNIREFGGEKYKGRRSEALYCIAEILNRFDIIAVQEIRSDLRALEEVLRIMGRDWDRIYTDVSYAKGGNNERLAFIWNRDKVDFTGLAGELVLPPIKSKELAQIARTPFICGFQAGWAKLNLCTVHIYYGKSSPNVARRAQEVAEIGSLLARKASDYIRLEKDENDGYSPQNLVLLGDFNIFKKDDPTFKALRRRGFVLPEQLMKNELTGSNVAKDKFYDQIAFYKEVRDIANVGAGIFDFYKYIFKEEDGQAYKSRYKLAPSTRFRDWRTYQMSDHLVMWTEFEVDKTDVYLDKLAKQTG